MSITSIGAENVDGKPGVDVEVDPEWAWTPYEPDDRRPWSLARAGHLYRRAAFGASWRQLRRAVEDGPERSVDRLLEPDADVDAFNRAQDEYAVASTDSDSTDTLRAWWLRRMIETPHPLLEKMTLFWHDHFATSNVVVKSARLMHGYERTLRRHALGCFRSLLEEVALDPALLLWLGSAANRRARPSEQYARSLLDVFTLGPGVATRNDIEEAARAFTGWFVLRKKRRFIPREHDPGDKRIFGREGAFGSREVIRMILAHPALPGFLVRKLYRWLISEVDEPGDSLVAPLAASFARDLDVAGLVGTILRSNLFFSPHAYRRRIRSPVEYALGIVLGLEGMVSTARLGSDLEALGQSLYQPPTVNGWAGGRAWINEATLLGRANLARALLAGVEPYGDRLDPRAIAQKHGRSNDEAADRFLAELLLDGDVSAGVLRALPRAVASGGERSPDRLRRLAHRLVTLPEYQLS